MGYPLRYVGSGDWLPGVPASDHTVSTKAEADVLVKSGLYALADGGGASGDKSDKSAAPAAGKD